MPPRRRDPARGQANVSSLHDISVAVGYRAGVGTGQPPATSTAQPSGAPTAADSLRQRFGGVFLKTFNSTMATVFVRGAAGEFDDASLRLQERAALERLRIAREAARAHTAPTAPAVGPGANTEPTGANAAPRAPATSTPAATAPAEVAVAEERELYALRVRQSEARLANISRTLARDFPKAVQLASASTGTWDPATFVPRSRDEVEAFAHRMVIDATESAARLEIVKTQLDAARFDAARGGGAPAGQLVRDLEASYARQKAYVDKLTAIVDEQSGGRVTDAGVDALAGVTLRGAGDAPVAELAAELRASGMDEEGVRRVIGATELGVEQERTPGGSERLRRVAHDMTTMMLARFNRTLESHREEYRRQEQERAEERRDARRRSDEQATARARLQRADTQQAREQRAAERRAEFEHWLATLSAAADRRRAS